MFKKIVSHLPFNPSLISNLKDYDLKLKKELRLRVIGFFILLFVLILQIIVTIFPPISTTIYSPNDLVNRGNGTVTQLFNDCVNNLDGYQNILLFYKLNCSDLYAGRAINLNTYSINNSLFSLNRLSYGANKERVLTISGQKLYIRHLSFGNALHSSYIKAQELNQGSQIVYIALDSGNIISTQNFLTKDQTPETCSKLKLASCFIYSISARDISSGVADVNNSTVFPGDRLAYTLSIVNPSKYKVLDFTLSVNLQNALAYSSIINSYGGLNNHGVISYSIDSMYPQSTKTEEIIMRIKSPIPNNPTSAGDPNYFNQKMITSFGNTLVVFVPKSLSKFYQINVNNILPSSGYGISLIILLAIILVLVYFIFRIILVREEIRIIKRTQSNPIKGTRND